jgi:hypothetical protein
VQAPAADVDLYQRTAGGWRRLLETVGIERRARDVGPTLAEYLESLQAENQAEAGFSTVIGRSRIGLPVA